VLPALPAACWAAHLQYPADLQWIGVLEELPLKAASPAFLHCGAQGMSAWADANNKEVDQEVLPALPEAHWAAHLAQCPSDPHWIEAPEELPVKMGDPAFLQVEALGQSHAQLLSR